jgi:hypothetical protein
MTAPFTQLSVRLNSLVLILVSCLALPVSAQDSDPGRFLPQDTTMVLHLRALSSLTGLEENHPIRRFAAHPAFEEILENFRSEFDLVMGDTDDDLVFSAIEAVETELGIEPGELSRLFPGQFTFAAHLDIKQIIAAARERIQGKATGMPQISDWIGGVLVADTTADADRWATLFERIGNSLASCADTPAEVRLVRESSGEREIIRLEIKQGKSDWYSIDSTLVNGRLVISISPNTDYFVDVAARLAAPDGSANSLAASAGYSEALNKLPEPDFLFHVAVEDAMKAIDTAITEAYATMAEAGPNPAVMMLPEANLRRILGLTDFKDSTMTIKILPEGVELMSALHLNGRTGLLAQLMQFGDGPISLPGFDPTKLMSIEVTSYDVSRTLELILEHAPRLSPMLGGMLEMQLMNLQTQGIDIRGGLIPALGEGTTVAQTFTGTDPDADQLPDTIYLLGCDDAEALAGVMEGIRNFVGQNLPAVKTTPRTLGEFTIHSVTGMDSIVRELASGKEDARLDYAIIGDQLVITVGGDRTMEYAVSCLQDGGHDLTTDDAINTAWNHWESENLVSFFYMDAAQLVRTLLLNLREGLEWRAEMDDLLKNIERAGADLEAAEGQQEDAQEEEIEAVADEMTRSLAEKLRTLPDLSNMHFYLSGKTYQTEHSILSRVFFGEKPE